MRHRYPPLEAFHGDVQAESGGIGGAAMFGAGRPAPAAGSAGRGNLAAGGIWRPAPSEAAGRQDGESPTGFLGQILGSARGPKERGPEAYSAASWFSAPASSGSPGSGRAMPRAMKLWRMG